MYLNALYKYGFFIFSQMNILTFGLLHYTYRLYCKTSKTGIFTTKQFTHTLLTGHNEIQRMKQCKNNLRRDSGTDVDDNTSDIQMKCVDFDLDANNGYIAVCAASKDDEVCA